MSAGRAEGLQRALASLRLSLREGAIAPGDRLAATEIAERLRLSPTPVREALSRLAGAGLIEDRPGQGFFVPSLTGADVADLYRMHLSLLLIAHQANRVLLHATRPPAAATEGGDAVARTEGLFWRWLLEAGGRPLSGAYRNVQLQLAPFRRVEAEVLSGLWTEAEALTGLEDADRRAERPAALRAFHGRRVGVAEALATAVQQRRQI